MARPIGGGGDGPRAAWWKEYSGRPEFKQHRTAYMRKWRDRKKKALLKDWTPASQPPDSPRVVLVVCEVETGDNVWLGYYEDDGWFLVDGEPVFVMHWMETPLAPR